MTVRARGMPGGDRPASSAAGTATCGMAAMRRALLLSPAGGSSPTRRPTVASRSCSCPPGAQYRRRRALATVASSAVRPPYSSSSATASRSTRRVGEPSPRTELQLIRRVLRLVAIRVKRDAVRRIVRTTLLERPNVVSYELTRATAPLAPMAIAFLDGPGKAPVCCRVAAQPLRSLSACLTGHARRLRLMTGRR